MSIVLVRSADNNVQSAQDFNTDVQENAECVTVFKPRCSLAIHIPQREHENTIAVPCWDLNHSIMGEQ